MFENITEYLKRHYNLKPTNRMIREEVCRVVREVCGIQLKESEMSVHGDQVFLKTRPAKRNEILLRHVELLQELRKSSVASGIHAIR